MEPFDVIACGLNVVDNMVVLPATVRRNEKHAVPHLVVQGGGPGPNQACGLAALGWRTAILAKHGDNTVSRIAEAEFTRCGVRLDLVIPAPGARPAMAVVEVDPKTGERTVFYNLDGYAWLTPAEIPAPRVREAKLVIADAYEFEAAGQLLAIARSAGVPSVLDVEAGDHQRLAALLELAEHIILSLDGGRQLTGCDGPEAVLRDLAKTTPAQLVVTDGAKGSWALAGGTLLHQPAFRIDALDTTGCGDSFHAAYASGLLDGWALPERLEFAAWIAAQVALALGARTNLPTWSWVRSADQSGLSERLRRAIGSCTR